MEALTLTEKEHGELCQYLDVWLGIWNEIIHKYKVTSEQWDYAELVNDTLSDLLVDDAIEAGL